MKNHRQHIIWILFSFLLIPGGCSQDRDGITISGAFALYPLAVKWRNEYKQIHPEVRIDIVAGGAGKGMADVLSGNMDLGMVSRDINEMEKANGAWEIAVTKDAVVPTFNTANPFAVELLKRGITREEFIKIYITGEIKTWGDLLGNNSGQSLQVFTRADAAGAPESWAKYLDQRQEDLLGVGIFGDPGIAEAVKKDIYAIGYNNLTFVYDPKTRKPYPGIRVIPIDINGNGKIDEEENFYDTFELLSMAVGDGIYPSPPARPLYFVSRGEPQKESVRTFLRWILSEGQQYVVETGFINLPDLIVEEELERLK